MDVGIVGLPAVGKTLLFRALTGAHVEAYDERPHVGVAKVPDPRLGIIAQYIETKKIVPATITFVDIPGVVPGSDRKKVNAFLEHVRQVDALVQVVRCFDPGGEPPAAAADIETLDTELVLADLVVADAALDRARRSARSGEPDIKARVTFLERTTAVLGEGTPLRSIDEWSDGDRELLKSYGFITAKPVLYVANVGEDDVRGESATPAAVREHAETTESEAVAVCASLEAELVEIEGEDHDEMLESLGLTEPAIGPLARAAKKLLGLTSFYTAGDKEIRAWAVPLGATAPEAAGSIHTDMQRGFIRAECYHIDELDQYKSEKSIREAGKLRSEGKAYHLRDGDVIHFLFNV